MLESTDVLAPGWPEVSDEVEESVEREARYLLEMSEELGLEVSPLEIWRRVNEDLKR